MNQIIHLNMMVEKELELERQGHPRTSRWIGNAKQAADYRWYRTKINRVPGTKTKYNNVSWLAQNKSRKVMGSSFLKRVGNLFSVSRKPARSEG